MEQRQKIEGRYDYYAFISYKREDEEWAKWLQHKLEHYRLPSNLNGRTDLPREIRPVFKDTSELNPGNLPQQIHDALDGSKFLIVVCSPRSAQSEWVNKEVSTFIEMGRTQRIIPFIIEGTAFSKDASDECFPQALRQLPEDQEILGANINEMGRDAAAVKVIAQMFGMKFDALWQRHEREQRRKRWLMIGGALLLALLSLGIGAYIYQKNVALDAANNSYQINFSRVLAEKANQLVDEGDSYTAMRLALEALPKDLSHPDRPYTIEAEAALRKATQHNSAILKGHNWSVNYVSYNSDGTRIISGSGDHTLRIWDANTGRELKYGGLEKKNGQSEWISSASLSPDDRYLASFSKDSIIHIWDLNNVNELDDTELIDYCVTETQCLVGHTGEINSVKYSPDGTKIVSTSRDGTIRVWNVTNGQELMSCKHRNADVLGYHYYTSAAFSSDASRIIATSMQREICILDAASGKVLNCWAANKYSCPFFIDISPTDACIITASDREIELWDASTGKLIKNLCEDIDGEFVRSVAFSPDGKKIVSAGDDKNVYIWDAETGEQLEVFKGHIDIVLSAVFSPDSKHVVSASADKTIRIWDVETSAESLKDADGNDVITYSANYSPDGTLIASRCRVPEYNNDVLSICNPKTFRIENILGDCDDYLHFTSFSPDGKQIAYPSPSDTIIQVVDVKTKQIISSLNRQTTYDMIQSIDFSPTGQRIVCASFDGVYIWDVTTRKKQTIFEEDDVHFNSSAFSPDGKYIVASSSDNCVRVWDAETGERLDGLYGHDDDVNSAFFSPDGELIVSASDDMTIRIWGKKKDNCWDEQKKLDGHTGKVHSAIFSPDGKYIVSASEDNTVRIWDVETGELVQILNYTASFIYNASAFFSPDGKQIVFSATNCDLHFWPFPPLQELIDQTRERFKDRQLTTEERRQYYLE